MSPEPAAEPSVDTGTYRSNGSPSVTILYVIVAVLCFAWWSQRQELIRLRSQTFQLRSQAYERGTPYHRMVDQQRADESKEEQAAREAALCRAIAQLNIKDVEEVQLLQAEHDASLALVEYLQSRGSCTLEPTTPDWMREFLSEEAFQQVTAVTLRSADLEADMGHVVRCSTIKSVTLGGSRLTLNAVSQLKKLPSLQSLSLDQMGVTDEQLMALSDIDSLETLSIHGSKLTDNGLVRLGQLQRLRELRLEGSHGITDAGLVHLSGLLNLHSLVLHRVKVTGSGLAHIRSLPLERLWLHYTSLDDDGLSQVAEIRTLKDLRVDGTEISDAGLQVLVQLKDLLTLKTGQDVSISAISRLRAGLPRAQIQR